MDTLYTIFDSQAIAAYWEDVNVHMASPYIGHTFFPNQKQVGLDLKWIKGKNNLPVVLQPSAFDTKATLRDRQGVTEIQTELPFFRESMRIGERDRQDISMFLKANPTYAEPIISRVFDDSTQLLDGALAQVERMRMQLLWSGKIAIKGTNEQGRLIGYDYNYDHDGSWLADNNVVLTAGDQWTVANAKTSNPLRDLEAVITDARNHGVVIGRVLMNSVTLSGLLASETITKTLNPLGADGVFIPNANKQRYVEDTLKITIETYDKVVVREDGEQVKLYPDGYVTLAPQGAVGSTWYGTTPEEFDLIGSNAAESVSIVDTGVAITTIKEAHPVNVFIVVSEVVLPSFEQMDKVYVLKAF